MSLPKWAAWALVSAVALVPATACSSRVTSCDELGTDWEACPNVSPLVCVRKTDRATCNKVQAGAVDAGTGTVTPSDGGACKFPNTDLCPTGCTSLASDEKNCGTCGRACATGETCFTGECQ